MNMQVANIDIFKTENGQSKKVKKALLKQAQRESSLFGLTELGGDCDVVKLK
jgi:hypothetical protein